MKRNMKYLAILCAVCMLAAVVAACGGNKAATTTAAPATAAATTTAAPAAAAETTAEAATAAAESAASGDIKIALITMDSIDQHWVTLHEGAKKAAAELGVTVQFLSPNTKDDAQQIECVNNAVAGKYDAIAVAANGPDAISSALNEAKAAGLKIVYVDSPANVPAEATFSTDNKAAGKTAGTEMRNALEGAGIASGKIGIVNVNAATDSCVKREEGFREAFAGSGFELLETQYGEGDASRSQTIAENYVTQGAVGIFGANEGSTVGVGNAIKASGNTALIGVGFDKSDAIMNLIGDGWLLCTMAQNPDVMGYEGVKAAVEAVKGASLGGKVVDTGVSVLKSEKAASAAQAAPVESGDIKIALITMDSIDQHWVTLHEGAQKAAAELGVTVQFLSPNTKDDAQQIECVNNAVAGRYNAIAVAANGPDAISSALNEAKAAGIKIVYVDSPANVPAEATFSTDNKAAGKTAGTEMRGALEGAGIASGKIGIVNVNAATDSCVKREEGFREAFAGSGFELLETQYGEGDAAKSQTIAENYVTQGVVGIFGANEGSTVGVGNAIKASGNAALVGVGFDKSDAIMNLIGDGWLLCTMAQNPDVMGYEGVKAAVETVKGASLGGKVVDTGVSVLKSEKAGAAAGGDVKIALITMDSIDQHWVTLHEGAQKAAAELGVTVQFLSPNTKDDAQQIECVNNAVAGGFDAIAVAANGPDAISSALNEAKAAGLKIVYVDSPANVPAEATFSTDNKAAGKTAGDELRGALEGAGITSGKIGIVNVNAATDSCVKREEGFREAFAGSGFELLETQYGEGDAAKSQTIAENYVTQGVVGIFGANEGSTVGVGNAIKASGNAALVGVGFDKSDAIMNLIGDGWLLCTMAQNPDVMGYEGVKAAAEAVRGASLGGKVVDTGVSVLKR